jgi:general secretion pathway protein B
MSLILDALRKMEQERNARRGAAQDLRPSVLRYRGAPREVRKKPYLAIAAAVVLVGAGLAAGILWKGNLPAPPAGEGQRETGPAVVREVPVPAASQPVPAPSPQLPAPQAAAPASPKPVATPAEPVRPPAVEPSRVKRAPTAATRLSQEPAAVFPAATAPVTGQPPGDISLSGIAWQDERNLRRAVLNGALVGEGAQVAGARVVEIKEDRVRLSRGGQIFEVQLSSAR